MSKLLRPLVVLASLAALVGLTAGCSVSSVEAPANLVVGGSGPLRLFASDGGTLNLDRCVTVFAPPGIASIGARGADGVPTVVAVAPGTTTLTVECGGSWRTTSITVWKAVDSFTVTPTATVADGLTTPLTATFSYADGSTEDVTTSATWSTTDDAVAVMGAYGAGPGEVTGESPGSTGYTASLRRWPGGPLHTASGTVTVGPAVLAALTISPVTNVNAGEAAQFSATGVWSDGTLTDESATTTWTTSDPAVVAVDTFSGTNGRVLGVDGGQATITGTRSGVQASILVTVTGELQSITLSPEAFPMTPSSTQFLSLSATYDGPSGSYDRVVTPWATYTVDGDLEVLLLGDAVAVGALPPFSDGTVTATLRGLSDSSTAVFV